MTSYASCIVKNNKNDMFWWGLYAIDVENGFKKCKGGKNR